jgi:alpha/beta superfamily hydrolase
MTIDDFIDDAESAIKYLKSRTEVNGNITVVGHSQGCTIAPIAAKVCITDKINNREPMLIKFFSLWEQEEVLMRHYLE